VNSESPKKKCSFFCWNYNQLNKNQQFSKFYSFQKGMTLVEILIVLSIIGSMMAVLIPNVMERLNKSKFQETKVVIGQLRNALNLYYTDCMKYPTSLDGLIKTDSECSNWGPEPYLKKLPKDGWKRDFQYSVNGNEYTIISLGSDGREGGDGLAKDINSDDLE
jgi:general secretion pathway protein G